MLDTREDDPMWEADPAEDEHGLLEEDMVMDRSLRSWSGRSMQREGSGSNVRGLASVTAMLASALVRYAGGRHNKA